MLHHHHLDKICFVEVECQKDGNINDEHTEHQEKEQDGCQIHQMHQFLLNGKIVKNISKHILDGGHALVAILPSPYQNFPVHSLVISQWQECCVPLLEAEREAIFRRGPPCILLV